jgi:aminopeptidase YwaD
MINGENVHMETDFMPVSFSANAGASGKVVFVGYGLEVETDSVKWNDYLLADVSGRWVLVLREDPEPDNMASVFIPFASDRAKVTLAKDKGAVGVLLVDGVQASQSDKPLDLEFDQNLSNAGIPVFSISRQTANLILMSSENSIEQLEEQIISRKKSMVINSSARVEGKADVIKNKVKARNVIFNLPSKKISDKYVVIGAHYDHLGMGGKNTGSRMPDTVAVHNGADDNASGVAGLLELAGYFAKNNVNLKQNLLFVAFDAEEMGTLGSKYFLANCPVDKRQISAMVNLDMIGRMKSDSAGISVGGTGTAKGFDELLDRNKASFIIHHSPDGYGPSDHAPFYSDSIPVLFFTTGAHEDYHTPMDDADKIDADKEAALLQYASAIIEQLAVIDTQLVFQSTGSGQQAMGRTRLKVTLGIIPDVAGLVTNGLGVDGVRMNGPAQKAGIRKGDKITAINGEPVTNIYDYMYRLAKLKPQTIANVEVERNGKKEVFLVVL